MRHLSRVLVFAVVAIVASPEAAQQSAPAAPLIPDTAAQAARKAAVSAALDGMAKQIQVMVDSVFSFGELGFEEVETSRYLTGVLEKQGFTVRRGIANIPTAWVATWGSGQPVIALGSDIDAIPLASQRPGVA